MKIDLKRVKAERIAKGYSQDDMAKMMGYKSRATYAKRENGIVGLGADELAQISEILEIPLTQMHIFLSKTFPIENI